jgi:hypothetical protein
MRSALLLLALWGSLAHRAAATDWIPLAKGTYWIYEGDVSWVEADANGQNQVHHKHLTWRSEITGVAQAQDYTAALFHGSPFDLCWYDSKRQPADRLVLLLGTDYYELKENNATDLFQKLKAAPDKWRDSYQDLDRAEEFLPAPLAIGTMFGGSPGDYLNRRFCNIVEGVSPFSTSEIKGAPKVKDAQCYDIEMHENTDHDELDVVPGIGIVGYAYSHNGTPMEVSVRLIAMGRVP